jgi:hypothetical protein
MPTSLTASSLIRNHPRPGVLSAPSKASSPFAAAAADNRGEASGGLRRNAT